MTMVWPETPHWLFTELQMLKKNRTAHIEAIFMRQNYAIDGVYSLLACHPFGKIAPTFVGQNKISLTQIAILASGSGSNAEALMRHFSGRNDIQIAVVVTNKRDAGVVARATENGVRAHFIGNAAVAEGSAVVEAMEDFGVDWIVLAGFLRKIPSQLISQYKNRIVNIHPSLLPKFGGKGMYGARVHKAVHEAGERESGITIHYVTEDYDEGQIIEQHSVNLLSTDAPVEIEKKVRQLELTHYPDVIDRLIQSKTELKNGI